MPNTVGRSQRARSGAVSGRIARSFSGASELTADAAFAAGPSLPMNSHSTTQMMPITISTWNVASHPNRCITQVRAGAAISGPIDAPMMTTDEGSERRFGTNQVWEICCASAAAGPSAKPRSIRAPRSTAKVTENMPVSGMRLTTHTATRPASSHLELTRPPSAPRTTAPTAKGQKKTLCMSPNCADVIPRSCCSSTPTMPTTTLSAKLTNMNIIRTIVTIHP